MLRACTLVRTRAWECARASVRTSARACVYVRATSPSNITPKPVWKQSIHIQQVNRTLTYKPLNTSNTYSDLQQGPCSFVSEFLFYFYKSSDEWVKETTLIVELLLAMGPKGSPPRYKFLRRKNLYLLSMVPTQQNRTNCWTSQLPRRLFSPHDSKSFPVCLEWKTSHTNTHQKKWKQSKTTYNWKQCRQS